MKFTIKDFSDNDATKVSQNSQKNTCARISFSIMLHGYNFI